MLSLGRFRLGLERLRWDLVVLNGNLGGSSEVLEGLDGASGGSQGHLGPELALSILLSAMDVKLDSTYYMQDTKTLLNEESS